MNYTSYVADLASTMIMEATDPAFVAFLPSIIAYAEQRCYQELDLLATRYRTSASSLTPASRNFTLPTGCIVVEELNVITPSGTQPDAGTRNPLTPVSMSVLDALWPSVTVTGVPTMFAMVNNTTISVGPAPAGAYVVEAIYTKRPDPLSASNPTTPLTEYCSQLFFVASMIFASGWQRDYGAQADDPKMAQSWEQQYQTLAASANLELWRQKIMSSAWSPMAPSPTAQPAR